MLGAHHCLEVLHLWDAEGGAVLLGHLVIVLEGHQDTVSMQILTEEEIIDTVLDE